MKQDDVDFLLKAFPGSRRAAEGIIVKVDDSQSLHLYGIRKLDADLDEYENTLLPFCSKNEILRLRQLRNGYDYLLRLRVNAIAESARAVRVMRKRRELFEISGRAWALTHYYHTYDGFHKSYISHLQKASAKRIKTVPSGLIAITEANAASIGSLLGDVVIVSESLYHFYYFMTIAVYGEMFDISFTDRAFAVLIAFRIMNEAESADFDLDPRGNFSPLIEASLRSQVHSQMQFTFGHEFAHVICGHTETGKVVVSKDGAEARMFNYGMEFEADIQAINNIRRDGQTFDNVARGGLSVMIFLNLLKQLKDHYPLRPLPVSETHPDPETRLWTLLSSLASASPLGTVEIENALEESVSLIGAFPDILESTGRSDPLTFYGSIYLPTYSGKMRLDRIDF